LALFDRFENQRVKRMSRGREIRSSNPRPAISDKVLQMACYHLRNYAHNCVTLALCRGDGQGTTNL